MLDKTYTVRVYCDYRYTQCTRKQLMLRVVNFGARGWYVYSRKLEAFLQADGNFSETNAYYMKTREACRKLIKRYFE